MSHERRVTVFDMAARRARTSRRESNVRGIAQRIDGLRQDARDALPGEPLAEFVALVCDRCGRRVEIEPADADCGRLPDGWIETEDGDLCPVCAA